MSPADRVRYGGHGTELLWHHDGERLLGEYARRPLSAVEPTELLGRAAWSVRVGPPSGKTFTSLWVVDAETGLLLRDYNELAGSVDEWVELVVGEPLDPALFAWDGPSVPEAEYEAVAEAARDARHEQDMASRRAGSPPTSRPLPLRFDVLLSVLRAQLGRRDGRIPRHPRQRHRARWLADRTSDEPWDVGSYGQSHQWTDGPWDWALLLVGVGALP